MKIVFTQDYTVQDAEGKTYKEGQTADVSEASANHFITRGVAVSESSKPGKAKESEKDENKAK